MNFRSPPSPDYLPFEQGSWRGWVHRDWQEAAHSFDLDRWQEQPHEVVRDRPTAKTVRMKAAETDLYLKHVTGITDDDPQNRRWINRFKWQTGRRSVFRTLRTCLRMNAAGFQTPKTLLAARNTAPSTTAEMTLTQTIEHPSLGRQLTTSRDPDNALAWLESAIEHLAHLHQAGFIHGDFLAGNLILAPETGHAVVFLDNDRTRYCGFTPFFFWRKTNLIQFLARLRQTKRIRSRNIHRLFHKYTSAWPTYPGNQRRQLLHIARGIHQRQRPPTPPLPYPH